MKNRLLSTYNNEKGIILLTIGNSYLYQYKNNDSSFYYNTKALDFLTNELDISKAYKNLGIISFYKNDFKNSLLYFNKSYTQALKTNNDSLIATRISDLAVIHDYTGNYDKAIEYYLTAIRIFEEEKNDVGLSKTYNNLGIVYKNIKSYDKSIIYLDKALAIKKKIYNKDEDIASAYLNLASVYEELKEYDKAIKLSIYAFKTFEKADMKKSYALAAANIAGIYIEKNELIKAKSFLKKAIDTNIEIKNDLGLSSSYLLLGKLNVLEKKYKKAEQYLKIALELSEKLKVRQKKVDVLYELIKVYENQKDFKQAYNFQKLYIIENDSLINLNIKSKIETLQITFDTQKQEQQIVLLEKENLLKENRITKNKIFTIALILILALIILIVLIIYKQKLIKYKLKTDIFNQKLLRLQMNPHFIFNVLTSIQSYMLENNAIKASRYLSSFAKLTRATLDNSKQEYITLYNEIETIEKYLEIEQLQSEGVFDYTIIIDENIDTENVLIPPMLTQPFIENSVKHAFKNFTIKGKIIVKFIIKERTLNVVVEDNGIGFSNSIKNNNHKSHAINIITKRLKILNKNRKENINFEIINLKEISDKSGTKIIFKLPLMKINNTQNV